MSVSYATKASKILQQQGLLGLSKASIHFLLRNVDPEYRYQFRVQTKRNDWSNRIRYDAPPSPYKTINIRSNEIETRISWINEEKSLEKVRYEGIARTKSGDWDATNYQVAIEDCYQIAGMVERFEQGLEWEETVYYKEIFKRHKEHQRYKKRGFDTIEEYFQALCEEYDQLYREIKSEGYRSNHRGSTRLPGESQPVKDRLEVLVTIDRHGTIHFFEGHHRFGIARALDLEIPAHVVCRHEKWQEFRDEIYRDGLYDGHGGELRNHPDLQDVLH